MSMLIILQKKNNGQAYKGLIALLLAGFALTDLMTCTSIASNLILVKFGLEVPLSGGLSTQGIAADSKTTVVEILQGLSGNCLLLIADTAIIWRAWALWAENRLVKWILLIILLADIGISITDSVAGTIAEISLKSSNASMTLGWLSVMLNLIANIVATILIAYQAWTHHQLTYAILCNKKTQVETILLVMVESGTIFGIVQVALLIFSVLDHHASILSPINKATSFIGALYLYGAALNPVVLVILIQTGNTYEHSFHFEDVPSLEISLVPNVN
ncbi:hypothetical protein BT96DRAFT_925345 [Gymnopus androsaceus JB14]|uniref:Uncharacterized protein n=1 Tax=Gymnopus androsaceus JB14 TaxID=1447944 RepID=A0A6A4H0L6_9AGAR|nr:hypothetical protein BT96DRAFT_925345 [Gymnopus androsaceus JB14]